MINDIGISSALPFLLGSWSLNAFNAVCNSSVVVGIGNPNSSNQALFIHGVQSTVCILPLPSPSSSIHGNEYI